MQKRFIALLIAILLFLPKPASAQSGVKLDSLTIELLAEYDQPSMLVINEFVVTQDTPLPAKVTLRFPKDGNLIAVAYNADGQLVNAPFESPAQQGDWQTITLNVDSYVPYRIEYYQALERDGNKRSFGFNWLGDYSVDKFKLTLSIPADSTEINIGPNTMPIEPSPNGQFLVGSDSKSDLKMGHAYRLDIEYQRTSDSLTAPNAANQVQPSEPLSQDTPGRVSVDQLPWIIGGVGIALIGFALIFYWRSLRSNASPTPARRRGRKKSEDAENENQEVYCHQCGARAAPGDRFCRTCGSKLRAE